MFVPLRISLSSSGAKNLTVPKCQYFRIFRPICTRKKGAKATLSTKISHVSQARPNFPPVQPAAQMQHIYTRFSQI
jgi:hypothetical protein